MAVVKAGIVTEAELEGPMMNGSQGGELFDLSAPSTWAFLLFLVAVLFLFVF